MKKRLLGGFKPKRENLLSILHYFQNSNEKGHYISQSDFDHISQELQMSHAELDGVISFYSMFSRKPRGKFVVRVCKSLSCKTCGSSEMIKIVDDYISSLDDAPFTLELVNCLGSCSTAPNIMINNTIYGNMNAEKVIELLNEYCEVAHG